MHNHVEQPANGGGARAGMALMSALLVTAIITIVMVAGFNFTQSTKQAVRSTKYDMQAYHAARAGLVDGINWFKRQPSQPVTKFKPAVNAANPTKGDTNDPYAIDPGPANGKLDPSDTGGGGDDKPHLGLVQEFPLDEAAGIWARYEVGKITKLERGTQGKLNRYSVMQKRADGTWEAKTVPNANSTQWEGVTDVTANYGLQGSGLIWVIRSHGYVYKRAIAPSPTTERFYDAPNEVLGQAEVETEIYRLQVKDYRAAARGLRGDQMTFTGTSKVRVSALGGWGIMYNAGTGDPTPGSPPPTFAGTYGVYERQTPPIDTLSYAEVFGVPNGDVLSSLADVFVTDLAQLPETMSTMALTYIKGNATFTPARPLNGGGILVVDGNLTLGADSSSGFSGVIYCSGLYTQLSPSLVTGAVIAKGGTVVTSAGDEDCFLEYNQELVNEVRRQLGQYRERRAATRQVQ